MASSISALSYLDPSANQLQPVSLPSTSTSGASSGVSATAELQAMQSQGDLQAFLNNSVAAALLQPPSTTSTATDATTLINNMLQQVLGAYQSQTSQSPPPAG